MKTRSPQILNTPDYKLIDQRLRQAEKRMRTQKSSPELAAKAVRAILDAAAAVDTWYYSLSKEEE